MSLEARLKARARELGFDLVGITTAAPPATHAAFLAWLAKGYGGEMAYLHRHADARARPTSLLDGVRSVVMLAMNYKASAPQAEGMARVASYAAGSDYHRILWDRLEQLLGWVRAEVPGCQGRGVVDSAPLLERDFARRAGLGWFGKNTMLIHPQLGSFFFLGALLLTLDLQPDEPFVADHCGTCTACLEACPTQAFPRPGELDATQCISYLTIEHRSSIPPRLREGMGDWLFGCDVCQDVCPWNHKAPPTRESAFAPRPLPNLIDLLALSPAEFRARFRETALSRAKRAGLLRNACIVLGNRGDAAAIPALTAALSDEEPLVREAAAWALDRLRGSGVAPLEPVE